MLQQVPLGVLAKSEQRGEDMVDILQHIRQYVPGLLPESTTLLCLTGIR